jgi:hypothetical protein
MAIAMMAGLVVVSGCVFHGYPLMPGEKVIFNSAERANAYREWSGEDRWRTGTVVTVNTAVLKRF